MKSCAKQISLTFILLVLASVSHGMETNVVETDSFSLKLAPGWKVIQLSKPITIAGPNNEKALMSSATISGQGTSEEKQKLRLELKENIKKAMAAALEEQAWAITERDEKETKDRGIYLSLKARTLDKSAYLYQYGLVGPSTAVLITVDGAFKDVRDVTMFEFYARTTITWK